MDSLINWFTEFTETLEFLVDYVIGFIEDLVSLVTMLGESVVEIPKVLNFMPSSISAILVSFIAIAVLFKVLGREG